MVRQRREPRRPGRAADDRSGRRAACHPGAGQIWRRGTGRQQLADRYWAGAETPEEARAAAARQSSPRE